MLLELFLTRWVSKDGGPGHGLTDRQIANRMGLGYRTLSTYKRLFCEQHPDLEMRIKGGVTDGIEWNTMQALAQLDPAALAEKAVEALQAQGGERFKRAKGALDTAELRSAIEHARPDDSLSVDGMLGILSSIAKNAPPQYKVQAIKLLDELQATHRPSATFGPPPPLTESERVSRLSRLISSVGLETLTASIKEVWPNMSLSAGSTPPLTSTLTLTQAVPAPSNPPSLRPEVGSSPTTPSTSGSVWTEESSTQGSAESTKSHESLYSE